MINSNINSTLTDYNIVVLLVDDQAIVGEQVKRMLAPEKDIVFHFCQDPTKAMQMAVEIQPTIILQDLVMPDIDGLTLVKFFRANQKFKDIPLIVLSSKEEAATKAESFSIGANDYLVKLPDRIELVARIRYHSKGYINLLQRNDAYNALLKSQQALAAELAQAAEYVISLLPKKISSGSITTDWRYYPSAQLGGDSFGYHWVDENNFAMYLLDVCDHGVGPALLSVTALNVLRTQTLSNTDFKSPKEVLSRMNDTFQMSKHNNLYFTLWYGVYNIKEQEFKFASAGHPPAIIYNKAESMELISNNFIIGALQNFNYKEDSIKISPPFRFYLFSDGVYEIHLSDGNMWNLEGLREYLLKSDNDGEKEIDNLFAFTKQMRNSEILDDDFSMLRINFLE